MDSRIEDAKFAFGYNKYNSLPEHKSNLTFNIIDDYIYENNDGVAKEENSREKAAKIEKIVTSYSNEIKRMSEKTKTLQRVKYSGGNNMNFKIEGALYSLTNDVLDEDVKSFYSDLEGQVLAILKN